MLPNCVECNKQDYTHTQGDYYRCDFCGTVAKATWEKSTAKSLPTRYLFDDYNIPIETDVAFAQIQSYAINSNADGLDMNELTQVGVSDVDVLNLTGYKTAIAAEETIADMAALQVIIDTVNAG